jgi:hypothetical protein
MALGAREPGLSKHELLKIMRIQRQSVKKYNAQQETVKHLQEIRRRQMVQDYETEYDNLRAAKVHSGPLHRAAIERLADLKRYIGKP